MIRLLLSQDNGARIWVLYQDGTSMGLRFRTAAEATRYALKQGWSIGEITAA